MHAHISIMSFMCVKKCYGYNTHRYSPIWLVALSLSLTHTHTHTHANFAKIQLYLLIKIAS